MGKTRYGLPANVSWCAKCVTSNQRPSSVVEHLHKPDDAKPTIAFDNEGVCSACRVAEKKAAIDWGAREKELERFLSLYRRTDGRYDVLVPGSGGKDSIYAAHVLKNKYGMHPLTCTWAPHIYTDVGWRNFQRWCSIGDNYLFTPNRDTHRLLTRVAVENLLHPFQPFIIGQRGFPARLASKLRIKLVMYGESTSEYGSNAKEADTPLSPSNYFTINHADVHIGGLPLAELKGRYGLVDNDVEAYLPLEDNPPSVAHLGYFLRWHPQANYYFSVEKVGFECSPERTPGTYSKYNSIDDKIDDLHYWTTFNKFGIGRATYDAAQEIRSGDITREEGVALVHRFDGEYPERFEREVLDYLSVEGFPQMTRERLFMLAEKFRPEHLWDGDKLRHTVK